MKFKIFKDKQNRLIVKNLEKKRKILLFLINNMHLNKKIRWTAFILLTKLNNSSSQITLKNRCVLTGNSKSISRKYRMSRISLKYLIFFKKLPGITKYTW
jgi:ribosomal protein S14